MGTETFSLNDIQSNEAVCRKYLSLIPTGRPFLDSIRVARDLCPELRTFCNRNQDKFNGLGARDKGSMGKLAEFYLFGQMPNSDSSFRRWVVTVGWPSSRVRAALDTLRNRAT